MMGIIGQFFGWCMYLCYRILPFYGPTIILFTLVTKIILLPISVLVQKNSIKMVQMYPELNRIKVLRQQGYDIRGTVYPLQKK